MQFRVGLSILGVVASLCGCRARAEQTPPNATQASRAEATSSKPVQRFGEPISMAGATTAVADVLASPERFQGRQVLVEGYVRRACSRRGCWMELAGGSDPSLEGCRVTFKDYGFFVPTDSAGSSARVAAALEVATLNPATVEHMEREGAKIAHKSADGSAREVRLVASGVELWR